MTEPTQPTIPAGYVAQLVLTVPGQTEPALVNVVLAPADTVELDGTTKALADCTLAELRAFANTLEDEIWQTSGAVTLLALHEERQVEIKLLRSAADGEPAAEVADPMAQIVIVSAVAPGPAESTGPAAAEPPATRPRAEKTQSLDDTVHILATPDEDEEEAQESTATTPTVIPSSARVRVAGQRHLGGKYGWAAVDILMDEPPLRAMQAHALSSMDREVAGVVIGARPEKQPDGRYVVHIIDSIAAKYTVMQGASVTYTADSWRYLNDTLAERYPNETAVMVGWYHTHPGFGIFLSGMDQFIHQNFFTQLWHIAYVLDPHARTSGFFCWNREKTKVNRYDFAWPQWASGSW